MDLAVEVYSLKDTFPKQEIYGLTSQMRRCAVSIPSNIAEGSGRHGSKEFVQFLYMANGSMSELETQLEIAQRLKYIEDTSLILEKIKKIRPMLLKLVKVINEKSNPPKSSDGKQDDQHLC